MPQQKNTPRGAEYDAFGSIPVYQLTRKPKNRVAGSPPSTSASGRPDANALQVYRREASADRDARPTRAVARRSGPDPTARWMRRGRQAISLGLLSALVLSCTSAQTNPPLRPVVEVCAIHASEEKDSTLVAVSLHGRARPRLAGEGTHLVLILPDAAAATQLGANMTSGGLVTRFALDAATPVNGDARLRLELSAPARAELVDSHDAQTVILRLTPLGGPVPTSVRDMGNGFYDVDAYQADAASLLKSVAQCGHTGVVLIGGVSGRVTVELRQVKIATAIEMLAKAAGLSTRLDNNLYIIGSRKDMDTAYPLPIPAPAQVVAPVLRQEVYHCNYIHAAELVTTLEKMFPKETLHAAVGGSPVSPRLEAASTGEVTGVQGSKSDAGGAGGDTGPAPRDVALWGEEAVVGQALSLARRLDTHRAQVKISVSIADVSLTALRELGVKWNWGSYTFQEEVPTHDINFGRFSHSSVNITAALSALEQKDQAKVLAAPSMSLLDGERGYVLIGDRLLFAKLIGYTQASTPIFDKEEVRVGIYLQVAAQVGANGEITLTIYPQVSTVTGYLAVPGGANYPQIGTREQKTTVRVKDGERIVVGGLIRDEDISNVQRVPFLSNIPLFGELFTYRKRTHNKSEVIITITPEILKD